MKSIEEIYAEAERFIDEKFPELKDERQSNNRRITILALMKMLIAIYQMEEGLEPQKGK